MAIPSLTINEVFSDKDKQTLLKERRITEVELQEKIDEWTLDSVGYVKGYIMESYSQYIATDTWKHIIKEYCKWKSVDQVYSQGQQDLAAFSKDNLDRYMTQLKDNIMEQAKINVIPNKRKNLSVYNPS